MSTQSKQTGAQKVLLVDDDVDFVAINREALELAGFEVVVAHDADEGLRQAQAHTVDVAVLDVMMRRPNEGFELARALRKDARTKHIPLVMLTSINEVNRAKGLYTFSDRDRDDTYLPVDRFVEKPVAAGRLIPLIQEMLAAR